MRILVPIDDELFAHVILQFLAKESWPENTVFRIIHVMSPVELFFTWPNDVHRKAAEKLVSETGAAFHKAFAQATIETFVVDGPPAKMILQEAEAMHADLVVMGSHARAGLARRILGSVSHEVALYCRCPLAVVRPPRQSKEIDVIFEGEPMTPRHRDYLREHINDHPFPVDGSDWSKLVQMRLKHEHEKSEPACNECLDFLDRVKSAEGLASHEQHMIRSAMRHWFLSGAAPLDAADRKSRVDQILRTLSTDRTPMTPEEAERDWLAKRSQTYRVVPGRYWVSQEGEAFESRNQLPARLEKQLTANRIKDKS